ncbi:uncharacterized protein LOC136041561 [Artemia franciscana]|uniref:uncharacterized protein LOC136041561 n=1 Tax=Artemia franciscana TaxID=6661 RepID=UPI0032DA8FDC
MRRRGIRKASPSKGPVKIVASIALPPPRSPGEHSPYVHQFRESVNARSWDARDDTSHKQFEWIDVMLLRELINSNDWSLFYGSNDVNVAFSSFISDMIRLREEATTTKFIHGKYSKKLDPWITEGILISIKNKNIKFKSYLKILSDASFEEYIAYRNNLNSIVRYAKRTYYKDKFIQYKSDMKKIWQLINERTRPSHKSKSSVDCLEVDGRKVKDRKEILIILGEYFSSVGKKLTSDFVPPLLNVPTISFDNDHQSENPFDFSETTPKQVRKIIMKLKNSSSSDEFGFSTRTVKQVATDVVPLLSHIYNLSFVHGVFPDLLKKANVIALNKGGITSDPSNYRGKSLLSVFSKLLEKIANHLLHNYLIGKNIFYPTQFGFIKGKSTDLAIHQLLLEINDAIDGDQHASVVFLDVTKAFDTVDHRLLFMKLQKYGFASKSLNFLKTYLTDRKLECHDRVLGIRSESFLRSCGVPQGGEYKYKILISVSAILLKLTTIINKSFTVKLL